MRIAFLLVICGVYLSCGTIRHVQKLCDEEVIDQTVRFEGVYQLSGDVYSVGQYFQSSNVRLSGGKSYTFFRILSQRQISKKEISRRPLLLEDQDIVLNHMIYFAPLIYSFLEREFVDSLSMLTAFNEDMLYEGKIWNKYSQDKTISTRRASADITNIQNETALVFSVHRCVINQNIFGGHIVLWSDDEYVKFALILPPDSEIISEFIKDN